jgi:hypothetical protein
LHPSARDAFQNTLANGRLKAQSASIRVQDDFSRFAVH